MMDDHELYQLDSIMSQLANTFVRLGIWDEDDYCIKFIISNSEAYSYCKKYGHYND